ncbi:MAG: substrate-binding domain-containing protein, partial [Prevotellaceae bacterium]|nr:substrate-binding domain-containing protein [Prevotellaceae bacterium]
MKKTISLAALIIAAAMGLTSCGGGNRNQETDTAVNVSIKGSDTVLPLSQRFAEDFMNANPGSSISVTGGGSGVGISALIDGTTDLAQSSRKIKFDEKEKIQ